MEVASMTYICAPYSHADPLIRLARFEAVNRFAARLMRQGNHVFSPLSHSHPIAMAGELPTDFEYWQALNRIWLSNCHRVIVLMLPGWRDSVGVAGEIKIATSIGLPIDYRNESEANE